MTQDLLFSALHPSLRLAQANTALFMRYASSPEVMHEAMNVGSQFAQQAGTVALKLMHGPAYSELTQGLMKNWLSFLSECSQVGMSTMTEGQAALWRQAETATRQTLDGARQAGRSARAGA